MRSSCSLCIVKCRKKGFSMAEALMSLLIMGIIAVAVAPMITQVTQSKIGIDSNTIKCIADNSVVNPDTSVWYTDETGVSSVPASGTVCYSAVQDNIYNKGKAAKTAIWYADHGTSAQKIMAKRILRSSCDAGGEKACDYFINTCWKSGSNVAPYCDDTNNFLDLTYYLHHVYATTTNSGAIYIQGKIESQMSKMMVNIVNEVSYACANNQTPNENPNLNTNIACDLLSAEFLITACNSNSTAACEMAYDNDYNTSCTAVRTNWADAPSGTYKLAPDGNSTTRNVSCSMTSAGTAAISGCDASPYVSDDCTAGYDNNYNRSCSQLFTYWSETDGNYNLTSGGAPPTDPVNTYCDTSIICIAGGIGTRCSNDTVYAGQIAAYYYFTTPDNQSGTYPWNNGALADSTATGASDDDGAANTTILTTLPASGYFVAPFTAAKSCADLVYGGRSDWFLPAISELGLLYTNHVAIGNFTAGWYWTSAENTLDRKNAWVRDLVTGGFAAQDKGTSLKIRCVRKQ